MPPTIRGPAAEEALAPLGDSVSYGLRAPVLESEGQKLESLPALPLPSCVTWGKLINLSELQFPHW